MDLWGQYFKEREGYETINTGKGVASYKINGEDCYIRDIYVDSDFRLTGEASLITDTISVLAKEAGCTQITGSIIPSMKGATGSMQALINYGFKIKWAKEDFICLAKEI